MRPTKPTNPLTKLAFDRVLVVVPPHGTYIASGRKKALVKSRRYYMEDQRLLVVEQKKAIAILRVARPEKITYSEFKKRHARHLVSEDERQRWWSGKRIFYFYPVSSVRKLPKPIPVNYPQGPQVFVRKAKLRYRRVAQENPAKTVAKRQRLAKNRSGVSAAPRRKKSARKRTRQNRP